MKKLTSSLKNCDFFSVTYSPAISDGMNYNHSSILGGAISIVIAILSLIYCIYYLYLWWSYSLLPKVTEDLNTFDSSLEFERLINTIQFQMYDFNGLSQIDPFKSDEIIIQPLMYNFDDAQTDYISLINKTSESQLDLNMSMGKDSQWILIFTLCKEQYLEEGQKCASDEQKATYFSQVGNAIYAQMQFTTINPSTFEVETFKRTYQIFINSQAEMCSIVTLHYQLNHYLINKAFLFSTGDEQQNYISNSLNYPTYAMKSYCDAYFLPDTYGAYWVLFQKQYQTISIVYPSISEVFAAIGSIISILFSVKYVITVLNLTQMRHSVLDDIMRQYYPEIRQFKIMTNFWGKIQSVKFRGFPVQLQSYLAFQKQIHQQMGCKLNYKNLLYEISRFQFSLMSIQRRSQIEKVHDVGIKVPLQLSDDGDEYVIAQGKENQLKTLQIRHLKTLAGRYDILTMSDAMILSQDFKKSLQSQTDLGKNTENDNDEDEKDFYDINAIKEPVFQ